MADPTHTADTLWRRFWWRIAIAAAIGAVVAFIADSNWWIFDEGSRFLDALREVGGAIVAGAALAALVVWFEDRREDDRIGREVEREDRLEDAAQRRQDQAARLAWRREVVIQLMGVVHTDLAAGRQALLVKLDQLATEQPVRTADLEYMAEWSVPPVAVLGDARARADSLLTFLRHKAISGAYEQWGQALDRHFWEVPPPVPPERPPTAIWADPAADRPPEVFPGPTSPPLRDPDHHRQQSQQEHLRWSEFIDLLGKYVDERYPADDD